jgi:hypothetical protein
MAHSLRQIQSAAQNKETIQSVAWGKETQGTAQDLEHDQGQKSHSGHPSQDGNATVAQMQMLWSVQYMLCIMAEKLLRGMQTVDPSEYNSTFNKA